MHHVGSPPPGYPGSAVVRTSAPGHIDLNVPEEQYMGSSKKRPFVGSGLYATSPMICCTQADTDQPIFTPLQLTGAKLTVECHIAMAFMVFQFAVDGPQDEGGLAALFLPKHREATVTEVFVENEKKKTVYSTTIVPKADATHFASQVAGKSGNIPEMLGETQPDLFTLLIGELKNGEGLSVRLQWFQPLTFEHGHYVLDVPLDFPMEMFSGQPQEIMVINCTINTGVPSPVKYTCHSHPLLTDDEIPGRVILTSDPSKKWRNGDFCIGYQVWTQAIVASVNVQLSEMESGNKHSKSSFALTLCPPAPAAMGAFQKSIVYLVDRSGSMLGEPINYAKNALGTGLDVLAPEDQFTIIAYDHEQISWSNELLSATADNITRAKKWMPDAITARGLTDILTPLQMALSLLSSAKGIPCVFLLTDGAVKNEREITFYLQKQLHYDDSTSTAIKPRVSTFGIGTYCNHYFLKQLAIIGRGQFDVAFRPQAIQVQMSRMLEAASKPVLTDVTISVPDVRITESYPRNIPDLFVGLPVLVSGIYEGVFPTSIKLNGRLPSGEAWSQSVQVTMAANIPLQKVFARQMLDQKTAEAWLRNEDPRLIQDIIQTSIEYGVVSAHTTMVGFESTLEDYQKLQKKKKKTKKINPSAYAIGGAAGIAILGGVGFGVGFGDLGSSLANAPVIDALSGGLGDGLEGIGDAIGEAGAAVCGCCGDCLTECFDGIGDCLQDLGACCETLFSFADF